MKKPLVMKNENEINGVGFKYSINICNFCNPMYK